MSLTCRNDEIKHENRTREYIDNISNYSVDSICRFKHVIQITESAWGLAMTESKGMPDKVLIPKLQCFYNWKVSQAIFSQHIYH
jgi:hypothetical protein